MRLLLLPLFGLAGACGGGGSPGTVVGVVPATVPNLFPHSTAADDIAGANVTGNQGSTHVFTGLQHPIQALRLGLDRTLQR
jgi:hypothetical protein